MGDADGAADHVGHREDFKYLIGADAEFVAFAEVVFDAVIAAQYHGSHKTEHFLGFYVEGALLVSLVVEAPEAFDHFVVLCQNALVHAGAVVVEVCNLRHFFGIERFKNSDKNPQYLRFARLFLTYNCFIGMRVVIQRVSHASVTIEGTEKSRIGPGLLILLGIEQEDTPEDTDWLCKKITALRIFSDEAGLMNRSVQDIAGEMLVVSQFTLHASTKKGNRPSFIKAARPDMAIPMYEKFVEVLRQESGRPVLTGEFGADMKVTLLNDGPVTILIDSKNRE